MSIADLVRTMLAAGAEPEIIAIAVQAVSEASIGVKKRSSGAIRQARYRERKSATNRNETVTNGVTVTKGVPEVPEVPKEIYSNPPNLLTSPNTPSPQKFRQAEHPRFAEFWTAYPSRGDAANPRKPASEKFTIAVRTGADPQAIISGAKRYSDAMRRERNAGTSLTMQATRFLHQAVWEQYVDRPGANGAGPAQPRLSLAERLGELPQPIGLPP